MAIQYNWKSVKLIEWHRKNNNKIARANEENIQLINYNTNLHAWTWINSNSKWLAQKFQSSVHYHKTGRWRKRACTWLNSLEWLVIIQEWMKDIPIKPNTAQYFAWVHFSNVYYFSFPFLFFSFEIDCEEAVFVCCELNSWNVNQIVSLMRIHIQTFSANVYTTHSARTHLPTRMCTCSCIVPSMWHLYALVYVYYIFWHILKRRREKKHHQCIDTNKRLCVDQGMNAVIGPPKFLTDLYLPIFIVLKVVCPQKKWNPFFPLKFEWNTNRLLIESQVILHLWIFKWFSFTSACTRERKKRRDEIITIDSFRAFH